ncbi:MAG: glycosyltransferase family 9 protein [Gammaproteobacteria bacterium]
MMNPALMRAVDYWVGVPACFLLTCLRRVANLVRGAGAGAGVVAAPRSILVIELVEMGVVVIAYPALRKLKAMYPDARIQFLAFRQIRPSIEMLGILDPDDILTIDNASPWTLARDTLRFLFSARRRRIDTVINLETFVRYSSILSFLTGARRRVGFHRFNQEGVYTGDLLTHDVAYNPHIHSAHTFLDLVHALDAAPGQVPRVKRPYREDDLSVPALPADTDAEARIWAKLRRFHPDIGPDKRLVIVNPNASELFLLRKLPLENYAALVERLLSDPDVFVAITGVAREKPDAEMICRTVANPRAIDLTGETTLTELLRLFDVARVVITNDSGPAHFACLTRAWIVVFFGPELPDRFRPLSPRCDVVYSGYSCSPCVSPFNQRLTPCNDNRCLKTLSVDDIYSVVRRRLHGE